MKKCFIVFYNTVKLYSIITKKLAEYRCLKVLIIEVTVGIEIGVLYY